MLFQFPPLREGRRYLKKVDYKEENFNSRPSARGDAAIMASVAIAVDFNSRPSARGDSQNKLSGVASGYFNSRPSARGDVHPHIGRAVDVAISIPAPPRGATSRLPTLQASCRFQFPPLREGRPELSEKSGISKIFQFPPLREGRQQKICNFCKSFVQPSQITAL